MKTVEFRLKGAVSPDRQRLRCYTRISEEGCNPQTSIWKSAQAFTLVELLVVIGIIAVLASLVLAIGSGVMGRHERSQTEAEYTVLDQAIVTFEQARGQSLVFNRRTSVTDPAKQDGANFSDIDELPPGFVNEAYIMPRLMAILAANQASWNVLAGLSTDLLRHEEKRWPDGSVTEWNLRDPWGEQIAVVPAGPDRAHGEDEFPHPRRRIRPGHAEALGDVRFDLRAETEDEAPFRRRVEIMSDVREHHGRTRTRHGDGGHQLDLLRVLRGDQKGEERIVGRLGSQDAGVPHGFKLLSLSTRLVEFETNTTVDLHVAPAVAITEGRDSFIAVRHAQSTGADRNGLSVGKCPRTVPCPARNA